MNAAALEKTERLIRKLDLGALAAWRRRLPQADVTMALFVAVVAGFGPAFSLDAVAVAASPLHPIC